MKRAYTIVLLCSFIVCFNCEMIQGQNLNPKDPYKKGLKYMEQKSYRYAIEEFTLAIFYDSTYLKGYLARAQAHEEVDSFNLALIDYENAALIDMDDEEIYYKIGLMYYHLNDYDKALNNLNISYDGDKKNVDVLQLKFLIFIDKRDYERALYIADKAIEVKKSTIAYYNKGLAYFHKKEYPDADKYYRLSYATDKHFVPALLGLANALYEQNKLLQAISTINEATKIDNEELYLKERLLIRSKIKYKLNELEDAIQDLSKVINMFPDDDNISLYYLRRGYYHSEFSQEQLGINDYTKVLLYNPDHLTALYQRGKLFKKISKSEESIKDFDKFILLAEDSTTYAAEYRDSKNQVFELQRESVKPDINIIYPAQSIDTYLDIEKDKESVELIGEVIDVSDIEYIKINGNVVMIENDLMKLQKVFKYKFNVETIDHVDIEIADVYNNIAIHTFHIRKVEVDKPDIYIDYPFCSGENELLIEGSPGEIIISGKIEDESLIVSCLIDEVIYVSYNTTHKNPSFSANVSILNKDYFTIKVEDAYGNITEEKYLISRDQVVSYADNPMGKTWAILIANYNYNDFVSLTGPRTELTELYNILKTEYDFAKVSKRENLSKEGFEELFQVELRDNVKNYNINSIFIWYAGHGLFENEMGYWIPTDAKKNKETSFYSHSTLKSHIESYADDLDHLLIVSDACQSGNYFWEITRSVNGSKDCNNKQFMKRKSKQVLTSSSNTELASDDSKFANIFNSILRSNDNACLPVDRIYLSAKETLKKRGRQTPQFGPIPDSDDQNGTFFFIRKND